MAKGGGESGLESWAETRPGTVLRRKRVASFICICAGLPSGRNTLAEIELQLI